MSEENIHRRPEFDVIATGWGGDGLDDLVARGQLLREYLEANLPLRPAERKVTNAMMKRLGELGGTPHVPEFN